MSDYLNPGRVTSNASDAELGRKTREAMTARQGYSQGVNEGRNQGLAYADTLRGALGTGPVYTPEVSYAPRTQLQAEQPGLVNPDLAMAQELDRLRQQGVQGLPEQGLAGSY